MTTRKNPRPLTALAALAWLALGAGGCATPGPLHVYLLATDRSEQVQDRGDGRAADVPSFLAENERLTGFAYDPYTDHFFLRLAPEIGSRSSIDRPRRSNANTSRNNCPTRAEANSRSDRGTATFFRPSDPAVGVRADAARQMGAHGFAWTNVRAGEGPRLRF
ncbi:MAG: hypothetical protein EXS38_11680 [Opitutus sp.]|nr:hypothetical protein [Opitutus sp.]